MALKAGYKGIKEVGPGLNYNNINGRLELEGESSLKLDNLEDVEITTPATGDIFVFDGDDWVNEQPDSDPTDDSSNLVSSGGVYDAAYYKAGDVITLGGNIQTLGDWYETLPATLTSSGAVIFVTIPINKPIKATGITFGATNIALRGPGGYIVNYTAIADFSVTFIGFSNVGIEIAIQKADGTAISADNNNKSTSLAMKGSITLT